MIEHPVEQGSVEWYRARLGLPTASAFDQIVTPVKCELSKSADKYAYRLIAERLLNTPMESVEGVEWMERGKELEPQAARQYQFVMDTDTRPAGFFTTDDGRLGASPDRVVQGAPVGLEIKAPSPHVHLGYLLDGPGSAYRPQVQGQLLVCEFEFVDFYSFHPRMPAKLLRTPRDESYIRTLKSALDQFLERLAEMEERARSLGVFQAFESAATPLERERAGMLSAEMLDAFGIPP